jgi:HK97 family phage major capsid protein
MGGGVKSGWVKEGDLVSSGKPKFRRIELNVNKLATFVYTTDELTEDGPLGIFVANAFTAEAAHVLDDMIVGGSGAGQPLGILNASATIVVPAQSGQTSGTIVPQNVANMFARILPECLEASVWLMSTDMLVALYVAPLVVATPGSSVTNLFTPPDAAAPYGRLMTRPVLPVEQASAIGTLGDIILADLSKYLVIERPLDIKLSLEVRFINGEGAYRFTYRVDGQPLYWSPITPKNGGPTKSAFVTLASR